MTRFETYAEATARLRYERPAPGRLSCLRWWLRRPADAPTPDAPDWPDGVSIGLSEAPTVRWARFLYEAVGEDWLWADRRRISDAELAATIAPPETELWTLFDRGQPAGFIEMAFQPPADADVAFLGLMPGWTGRGLGPRLLAHGLRRAAARAPGPVTVNTCTLDHPKALAGYQAAGFIVERTEPYEYDDPRLDGAIPRTAAPHVPLAEIG